MPGAASGTYHRPASKPPVLKCPNCATTYTAFKETGFVGCAQCYDTFHKLMQEVVKKIHGSSKHTGISYSPSKIADPRAKKTAPKEDLKKLKSDLSEAIKKEAYEKAAILRDKIKEIVKRET
ncbi:UvrB/UvrC motif-containing protein [Elusimicrobiota bacterium]